MSMALALIAAGCTSGSAGETVATDAPAPTEASTTAAEPTGSVASEPTSSAAAGGFTRTADVFYLSMNGVDLAMDVYAPAGDGPWPMVVAFHGVSSVLKDAETTTVVAEEAAGRGMVVFTPSWIAGDPFPLMVDDIDMLRQAANCSVAFAQQLAPEFGGDPERTVVYGFSAGAGPALVAAVQPSTTPVPGCETDALPLPVAGVVLGDGEYFFHSANFDGAFQEDLDRMQAEVAAWTDPTRWPAGLDATFSLWAAADGTAPRAIDDPAGPTDWLGQRDPTGSIRSDLDRLGALEDGIVDNIDSARLLHLRLSDAGFDASFDEFAGVHTTLDKAPALVDRLQAAAG